VVRKIIKITGVKHGKSKKARQGYAKIGDWVKVAVKKGIPDMKGKVFDAVIIRQKKTLQKIKWRENCI